jgi:myo-inositol-1(or 4)-monophosphatase
LVKEAGGLITDLAGGEDWYDSGNIVCGNRKLLRQMLAWVRWTGP